MFREERHRATLNHVVLSRLNDIHHKMQRGEMPKAVLDDGEGCPGSRYCYCDTLSLAQPFHGGCSTATVPWPQGTNRYLLLFLLCTVRRTPST